MGSFEVDTLEVGNTETVAFDVTLSGNAPTGALYLGAIVDDDPKWCSSTILGRVTELDESNNTAATPLQIYVPLIYSVKDIAGDEGGYVFLKWFASPLDDLAEGALIKEYTVWRTIDIYSAASLVESGAARVIDTPAVAPASGDEVGRIFRQQQTTAGPIFWELIGVQPAYAFPGYGMTVATTFDSTSVNSDYHYFQVIGHLKAAEFPLYVSPRDSARSTDDLAPVAPQNLIGTQSSGEELTLTWDPNTEADLFGYSIHRDTNPGFIPSGANQIAATSQPEFADTEWRWNAGYYYKVCALDIHENASDYAALSMVTAVTDTPTPRTTTLAQNIPNPFNPSTTIGYAVSERGLVRVAIYDPAGRLVRTLVDDEKVAGAHTVGWNGRDQQGRKVASGVYFYQLSAGNTLITKKMVLLK